MNHAIRRLIPLAFVLLLLPAVARAQRPFSTEVYQDFRGKPPMLPEFSLEGLDVDTVASSEAAGFRIKLPKTRKVNRPVQIGAKFVITGDFEITGTYELLAADAPTDGYGVGVSLNLATTNDFKTFLKICRVMRPNTGSVFMAEYWTKGADDWKGPQMPTDVQSGQLRLVREGAKASCQVSDGPGKPFATIFEKDDFSTDDIVHLRFHVTDGQKPGYAVDARLVDLRVRYGRRAAEPDAKVQAKNPVQPPERPAAKNNWLAMTLGLCLATTLVFASVVALLLYVFRRSPFQGAAPALEQVAFVCAGCGKSLKTKAVSAGKKLKCPQCGTTGVVPSPGVAPS